jgi:hypothetical protein
MFEKNQHQLLPKRQFLLRQLKFAFLSVALIGFSIAIGTIGYSYFADLGWVDSFYNASMILTGMGPVNKLENDAAKLFASFYALFSGVAFLSTVAVLFAPSVHRLLHKMQLDESDLI